MYAENPPGSWIPAAGARCGGGGSGVGVAAGVGVGLGVALCRAVAVGAGWAVGWPQAMSNTPNRVAAVALVTREAGSLGRACRTARHAPSVPAPARPPPAEKYGRRQAGAPSPPAAC